MWPQISDLNYYHSTKGPRKFINETIDSMGYHINQGSLSQIKWSAKRGGHSKRMFHWLPILISATSTD